MDYTSSNGLSVLIVEDDDQQRQLLSEGLERNGFEVRSCSHSREAVLCLHDRDYDAMISDLRLPGMNGSELLRYVRLYRRDMPFLMVTGVNEVSTAVQLMKDGADEYLVKPVLPSCLPDKVMQAISRRAKAAELDRQARRADRASLAGFLRGVQALVHSLEAKDLYTKDHSRKVAQIAMCMAKASGRFDRRQLRELRIGALLHDVGKIAIPLSILHKEGRLSSEEWDTVKLHPVHGERILQPLARSFPEILRIVRHEHERFDGNGYPDGLAGEAIPLGARLVMIADTYDAVTSSRPYRKGRSKEAALDIIREGAGTQFDPGLVPVFEQVLPDLPEPRD